MRLDELNFDLPRERIAQRPLDRRDDSRLLQMDRATGAFGDRRFVEFPSLLRGDELLILNNARVIPARLFGRRSRNRAISASGESAGRVRGEVEVFLTRRVAHNTWEALVRPGKKLPVGERVEFGEGELEGEMTARGEAGIRTIQFRSHSARSVSEHLEELGHVPLPPYIDRVDDSADRERYQ